MQNISHPSVCKHLGSRVCKKFIEVIATSSSKKKDAEKPKSKLIGLLEIWLWYWLCKFQSYFTDWYFKSFLNWCPQMNAMGTNTDGKLTLVHVMAWYYQAARHNVSQCCPRSISPSLGHHEFKQPVDQCRWDITPSPYTLESYSLGTSSFTDKEGLGGFVSPPGL